MADQSQKLLTAVRQQNLKQVKLLLANGANPNSLTDSNNPLVIMCIIATTVGLSKKVNDIIGELLAAGADVNITFGANKMPLLSYIVNSTTDVTLINVFVINGVDTNAKAADGSTPLIEALKKRHNSKNIQTLLISLANPNIPDNYGKYPIHYAIDSGDPEYVKILLEKGAALDVTLGGKSLSNYAQSSLVPEIRALFGLEAAAAAAAAPPLSSPGSKLSTTSAKSMTKPHRCFDPIIPDEVDIEPSYTVFYIKQPDKTSLAYCIDSVTLTEYKTKQQYLFYRCKSTVPAGSLHITRNQVESEKLRRLDLGQRIYIKDEYVKKLKPGKAYILEATKTPVGRIVSDRVLNGDSVVGAIHCQDIEPGFVHTVRILGSTQTRIAQSRPGSKGGAVRRALRRTRRRKNQH